jgi:hypothetical protein
MVIALTPAREQELRTRMLRGVEALDATTPNWWKDIDLERLNLKDCVNCVLGQLYNNYTTGVQALTELLDENHLHADEHFDDSTGHIVASHYGFDHDDELQCEWADEDDNLMEQGVLDASAFPELDSHLDLVGKWWGELIRNRQQEQS